jgi:hypothetical protein
LPGGGYYAYGPQAPDGNVTLYYEYQWYRTNPVVLPNGSYKCRFVLTEESFHNNKDTTPLGGYWKGVLATEDYNALGQPDSNPANDVTFAIGADAPQIGTMSPQAALDNPNATREFAVPYTDADGDLHHVYLQVGSATGGLQCLYNVASRKLYLRDDTNQNWLGGFAPGTARIISNSRGSLNCAATTVENIAGGVRVRWNLRATTAFPGATQPVMGFARDRVGLRAGWTRLGTWTINHPPQNVSVSPFASESAAGAAKAFTTVYRDPNGSGHIAYVIFHVGDPQSVAGALRGYYNVPQNKLYLLNDAGTQYQGGFAPGSSNVISNAQGSLDCAATSVSASGNTLTVNWSLTPALRWANTQHDQWLFAIDRAGARAPWAQMGRWSITG